jgi:hypothetical protein
MTGFPEAQEVIEYLLQRVAALEASGNYKPGDFKLFPFRADSLQFGFYLPNGDRYSLESPQGEVLYGLPLLYKADWGITVENDTINLPNLFAPDGRGYYFRVGAVPGVTQSDAMINIASAGAEPTTSPIVQINNRTLTVDAPFKGLMSTVNPGYLQSVSSGGSSVIALGFDASLCLDPENVADEVRPLTVTQVPGVFLGV